MISSELKSTNMPEEFPDSHNTDVDARLRAIEENEEKLAALKNELNKLEEKGEKIAALKKELNKNVLSAATVALIGSFLGLSASLIAGFNFDMGRDGLRIKIQDPASTEAKIDQFDERLRELEVSIKTTKAFKQNGQGVAPVKIASDVESLNNRMNSLSIAILASPERALAIPLLRKDIDGISKRMEELRVQGKSDMDRLYDQQKWMLGGIGTVLLAVAGGAITIILRTLPKGD
jgi:hypothetical protein